MRTVSVITITTLIILCAAGCFWRGNDNTATYTGPPERTVDLDRVVNDADPRYAHYIYPPDTLTIGFVVPGKEPCRVMLDVRLTPERVVRTLIDSVYAPGSYAHTWSVKNERGVGLQYKLYFYNFNICGEVSTRRLDYRRKVEVK
ncbi:MAG: hypothetical protein JW763_06945 [candidate division Zixibacteria bacterium]|nr:hypothetical protein [candidate division Zixibacteria bacterium]